MSVRGRWSWKRWESSELGRCRRCVSGVRWQGGKRWENSVVAQSESWEGSAMEERRRGGGRCGEMARRERLESSEVAR